MRRFTHTFPQRISAFLLCLALLVGLLPVTALAEGTAPQTLYVGGTQIYQSGYWKTNSDGTLTSNGASADNYNVYYDGSGTLTLKNATIEGGDDDVNTSGAGIYAASSSGPVSLNIVLEEENKVSGMYGIDVRSRGGDASLNISGSGSLTTEGSGSGSLSGILVQSNAGNANLTINNVDVTVTNSNTRGIWLQSADSSSATLTVTGGELTASGKYFGIDYVFGDGTTDSSTPTVTVSGNAIVRANGSVGGIKSNSSAGVQYGTGSDGTGGIVFDGNTGTVYGDVELQKDLTIGEGESLTIPDGASLTIGSDATLTVDGGTLTGNVTGDVNYKVTGVSLSPSTLNLDVGASSTLTATITPDNATDKSVTWESSDTNIATVENGKVTAVAQGSTTITATAADGSGEKATCSVTVKEAANVPVTSVSLDKTTLELKEGETAQLTATVAPTDATNKNVTWASSNSAVATVDATGNVKAVGAGTATITVTAQSDNTKSATCAVTVEKPYTPPPYIPPTYAVTVPDTTGGTVEVSPSRASSGRRVTITTQPDPGYELESLTVLDSRGSEIALTAQGDGKFTFTMPSRKVTVQASFAPVPLPFEDVAPGAWYESAVRYAYTHGIMEGTSATTFVPGKSLTRAEAVQVLYNLEGQPTVSESATFPDLVYQWYKPAIAWAESTGVVDGYEDGTFQPGQPVTRQEFAQMLYDYAAYKDYDLTAEGDLSAFPDGDSVQEWALSAMTWANGNALINGHDDGTLEPGGTTTRAQAASILMRFDQNVVEN